MPRNASRRGFTLIELLIVVVIIGILAAIAIPKFGNTKTSAQVATLKADLRNLATAQETYFSSANTYAGAIGSISPTFYQPSANVTVALTLSGQVYTATAVYAGTRTCKITVNSTLAADSSGTPIC